MEPQANRPHPGAGAAGAGAGDHGRTDVLESGGHPPRFPRRGAPGVAVGLVLVALAVWLLLGTGGGHHKPAAGNGKSPLPPGVAIATGPAVSPAINETGRTCSVQRGHTLQLGVEVVNQSDRAVVLRRIAAVLPLGGLRPVASQWGPCGLLPGPGVTPSLALAPSATGWLAVTFDVTVACPKPSPVGFRITYLQAGRPATADLSSFPDLSQVPYSGCHASPAAG